MSYLVSWLVMLVLSLDGRIVHGEDKCSMCEDIVKNIKEGIENTAKSNFGGGNTNWEERSLGSYTFSETRLIEILENACKSSSSGCHTMLEEYEEEIEDWWFKLYAKGKEKDPLNYLCIQKLKVCCPEGTFGPDCKDCDGGKERPCKGNGNCQGGGTRSGTGKCNCNSGYQGELCDECTDKYYEKSKNDTHTVCEACDVSCKSSCWEAGPSGCDECKDGWEMVEDKGCQDINECEPGTPCEENQYCTNTAGSYKCSDCSKVCNGCTGPGPMNCAECADRHYKLNGVCKACHAACEVSCTDGTPKTCDQCRDGWMLQPDEGCIDVDECATETHDCGQDEYCVNTEGSFKCPNCHYACDGCTGPAANNCKACKTGYSLFEDGYCTDIDECDFDGTCSGEQSRCINTAGSYKCECEYGFELKEGKCTQKPKDPPPKRQTSSSSSSEKKTKNKDSKTTKKSPSNKKSKKKNKKKDVPYWQYWVALIVFGVGGILLRSSVFAQLVYAGLFWLYVFWFSVNFEKLYAKT